MYSRSSAASLLAALFAGVLIAAPTLARAQEPLTLAAAQRAAVERSQLLRAQDSSAAASREMAVAAGQLPDPVIKAGLDNLPIEGPDRFSVARDFMTMRRIGVMQEVTRDDKLRLRSERFEREAEKTLAERNAALAQIERETALAWLDRWYAEAMASRVAAQITVAEQEIEAAEAAYRAGRGAQAEVLAARSMLASLRDRASEIARKVRTAQTALARWVPASADHELGALPPVDRLPVSPDALEAHVRQHPDLDALSKQEAIADAEARLAQANKRADWTWELAFQQRGSSYGNMVSIGVSIPLQWDQAKRQDREAAAKLALVDEARARREETLRAHVAELKAMLVEWDSGRERRARYRTDLEPLAAARTEALIAAYRAGRSPLAEVLAAQRNETDIALQALQLEQEIARAWAQITFLVPQSQHATLTAVHASSTNREPQ
jgi:outer membrane protein TolC